MNGAEASTLLQPELKSVFEILLDQAESSLGSSDLAGAMLDQIRANLRAGENFDWEAEFAAVKRLGAEVQNISGDLTEELALSVGAALDAIHFPEVVGCIAGDDTVMCAVRTVDDTIVLMDKIRKLISG